MLTIQRVSRAAVDAVSKLLHLQLRGLGAEEDDAGAETTDDAPVLGPFGLSVRPVVQRTLRALVAEIGDESWVLALLDKARSPTDLSEGETRVWSVGKTTVRIRVLADEIVIDATSGHPVTVLASEIRLGTSTPGALDGIVHGSGYDTLTGQTHTALGNTSAVVKAKK